MPTFPEKMLPPLDELAAQLLPLKQYRRLHTVAELLDVFSTSAWSRIEESEKERFIQKLELDFHSRAWDDWDWKAESAYSRINTLIAAEAKNLRSKK